MTHSAYTVTFWTAVAISMPLLAVTVWAATISVTAVVATLGPLTVTTVAAVAAWKGRDELRATHVPDLAAANQRENDIAHR